MSSNHDHQHPTCSGTHPTAPPTVAPIWRKSTVSNPTGNCVELAVLFDGNVAVRNSRSPDGRHLIYTRAEIAAFVLGVQAGEFDDFLT